MDITRIQEAAQKKHAIETARREFNALVTPSLRDITAITQLWEWFNTLAADIPDFPTRGDTRYAQRFIFIITTLYSPSALFGGRLRTGLRSRLSRILGVSTWTISHNTSIVQFLYSTYPDFKRHIEYLYPEILFRAERAGLK